jgi:hypothetical protein
MRDSAYNETETIYRTLWFTRQSDYQGSVDDRG